MNLAFYDGTNTGESEKIDIETAIELCTHGGLLITCIPKVGQLSAVYSADFILLIIVIIEIFPKEIEQIYVEGSYHPRKMIYQKEAISLTI